MLSALDHNDIMGLIVYVCAVSLWSFLIGVAIWSRFASEHSEPGEHAGH